MNRKIRVTVWNEFRHEREMENVRAIYPNGIHSCIGDFLSKAGYDVTLATLIDPGQGLSDDVLDNTDVLIWWGHIEHHKVDDAIVEKIASRVFDYGMGFIALHSAHKSKPFCKLVGTSGNLLWGDDQRRSSGTFSPLIRSQKAFPSISFSPLKKCTASPL